MGYSMHQHYKIMHQHFGTAVGRHFFMALLLASATSLAGCGGGGGSSDAGPVGAARTNPAIAPAQAPSSSEILRSNGLRQINAEAAYDQEKFGTGVTVAVIDTGIDIDHPDLQSRVSSASIDIVAGSSATLIDQHGHGTHVAGIIASAANSLGTVGVSPGATILAIRADSRTSPGCNRGFNCGFSDTNNAAAINYAIDQGAKVINLSQGKYAPISSAYLAALTRAAASDVLVVAASGNDNDVITSTPASFAGSATMGDRMLAVGAVASNNNVTAFSNKASSAAIADHFLVAPGQSIRSTYPNGGYARASGTSQATAFVSGAAAVLRSAFPTLSMAEVSMILRQTAVDLGVSGTDLTYGRGLIDLEAALRPSGGLSIPLSGSIKGAKQALASASMSLSKSFGDAAAHHLGGAKVLTVDAFNRPYAVTLGNVVRDVEQNVNLADLLIEKRDAEKIALGEVLGVDTQLTFWKKPQTVHDRYRFTQTDDAKTSHDDVDLFVRSSLSAGDEISFGIGSADMDRGNLVSSSASGLFWGMKDIASGKPAVGGRGIALASHHHLAPGLMVGAYLFEGNIDQREGAKLGYRSAHLIHQSVLGKTGIAIGMMDEQETLLGSHGQGVFRTGSTQSHLMTLSHAASFANGIDLFAQATMAKSRVSNGGGAMIRYDEIQSNAWAVGMTKRGVIDERDEVGVLIGQPMRSHGDIRLNLPRYSTIDGQIVHQSQTHRLEPSGRELDLQLAYRRELSDDMVTAAFVQAKHQAGHRRNAGMDVGLGMRIDHQF